MSNSSLAVLRIISPNRNVGRNHSIDTITIHCMAGNLSIESCGNLFARSSTKASSNYGIGSDGRIAIYVDEADRSWATSSGTNDNRAITIEVASEAVHPYRCTDAAYRALINLLVDICQRNPGIKDLRWKGDKNLISNVAQQNMTVHRWFAMKACPGDYLYNLHGQIASEVNYILKYGKYGPTLEKKKYELTKKCYLKKIPGTGEDAKVKYKALDDSLKKRCVKDDKGFALMDAGKKYDRVRKYTGSAGNTWHQIAKGYWMMIKTKDGKKYTKAV